MYNTYITIFLFHAVATLFVVVSIVAFGSATLLGLLVIPIFQALLMIADNLGNIATELRNANLHNEESKQD